MQEFFLSRAGGGSSPTAGRRGLPSGLKPRELKWEEAVWDPDTAMFLRRGSLTCDAYFTAAISEDGLLLSDFILKGVVTN